jgi:AcrR family transcriptional regulator
MSEEQRPDRRRERTRRTLQDAFFALLTEQPYEAIRVQDITERADTTKVTFYRYFRDKDELYRLCIESIMEQLMISAAPPPVDRMVDTLPEPPIFRFYTYLIEHRALYRVIFAGPLATYVQMRIVDVLAQIIRFNLMGTPRHENVPVPLELMATHIASALWGNLFWWFNHDMPYPAKYMAQATQWLLMVGTEYALGTPPAIPAPSLETKP